MTLKHKNWTRVLRGFILLVNSKLENRHRCAGQGGASRKEGGNKSRWHLGRLLTPQCSAHEELGERLACQGQLAPVRALGVTAPPTPDYAGPSLKPHFPLHLGSPVHSLSQASERLSHNGNPKGPEMLRVQGTSFPIWGAIDLREWRNMLQPFNSLSALPPSHPKGNREKYTAQHCK